MDRIRLTRHSFLKKSKRPSVTWISSFAKDPFIVLSTENHSAWGTRLAHPSRGAVSVFRDLSNTDETRVTFKLYPQDIPKEATPEIRPVVRKLRPNKILFVKGSVRMSHGRCVYMKTCSPHYNCAQNFQHVGF